MSQNGQVNLVFWVSRWGIPSTTVLVRCRVRGAGCPMRWCHSSILAIALLALIVQLVLRGLGVTVAGGGCAFILDMCWVVASGMRMGLVRYHNPSVVRSMSRVVIVSYSSFWNVILPCPVR